MNLQNNSLQKRNQRLSVIAIEQSIFHRLQVRNISELYKLSIKIKKPIILILKSLPVLQQLDNNSQYMNAILRMENLFHITIQVSGFGIFNQKHVLQKIGMLMKILSQYSVSTFDSLKQIKLQFPGWRTFSSQIIYNIFKFVRKCTYLQEFSINISHALDLRPSLKEEKENHEDQYYGKRTFKIQQFDSFIEQITMLPETLNLLYLKMSGWQGVDSSIVDILTHYLKIISQRISHLSILKLDLNGWNQLPAKISKQSISALFRCIEDFQYLIQIEMDLRNWNNDEDVKRFKEFFGKGQLRKEESWNMTGTNNFNGSYMKSFFGSHLKSKQIKNLKVVILD